jgi:hypothetical protein
MRRGRWGTRGRSESGKGQPVSRAFGNRQPGRRGAEPAGAVGGPAGACTGQGRCSTAIEGRPTAAGRSCGYSAPGGAWAAAKPEGRAYRNARGSSVSGQSASRPEALVRGERHQATEDLQVRLRESYHPGPGRVGRTDQGAARRTARRPGTTREVLTSPGRTPTARTVNQPGTSRKNAAVTPPAVARARGAAGDSRRGAAGGDRLVVTMVVDDRAPRAHS